jgi:hypothetical protein
MNSKFGTLARLRTLLKMSCEHFQRGAGEHSEPEKPNFEFISVDNLYQGLKTFLIFIKIN